MKLITTFPRERHDVPAFSLRLPPRASETRQSYYGWVFRNPSASIRARSLYRATRTFGAYKRGVTIDFSRPGKPKDTAFIEAGMHVTGTSSPYGYFQSTRAYVTADVSALIKQHVLLLAGSEDHLVPMTHFHRQIKMLKNARSITARLFTKSTMPRVTVKLEIMVWHSERSSIGWMGCKSKFKNLPRCRRRLRRSCAVARPMNRRLNVEYLNETNS